MNARRFAKPAVALAALAALSLASGCAMESTNAGDDPVGSAESADVDSSGWTWQTNGFQADGKPYTVVITHSLGNGVYQITLNGAHIDTSTDTLKFSSAAFSYTTAAGTTAATAGANTVLVSAGGPPQPPTAVTAGAFSVDFSVDHGVDDRNYRLQVLNTTLPGTDTLLPPTYGSLAVSASAPGVGMGGAPLVGTSLGGEYVYHDSLGLPESGSAYVWYRDATAIATASTYTLTSADVNHSIKFCVAPSNSQTVGTGVPQYCSSAMPIPSIVAFSGKDFTGTAHGFFTAAGGCVKGLPAGVDAGSVVINATANGVGSGGACPDGSNLVNETPSNTGAVDVSALLAASYGISDTTASAATLMSTSASDQIANDPTFGDPNLDTTPTLANIYTYDDSPQIEYVIQGDTLIISA